MTEPVAPAPDEHWHYALTGSAKANPAVVVETMTGEEKLTKARAKKALQPLIREAQGRVRYPDPEDPAVVWEPADWWIAADELLWIQFPEGPLAIFCVYPCQGDCTASALAHRAELTGYLRKAGVSVTLEPAGKLN